MNDQIKKGLFTILIFYPLLTFASGQEVLVNLYLQFFSIILFVILLLWVYKVDFTGKLLLILIAITSTFLSFYFTGQIPYLPNKNLINTITFIIPQFLTFIGYLTLKSKYRNE